MNLYAPWVRTAAVFIWILVLILGTGHFDPAASQITQRLEIPSSPNPVGSGARALGMGGAFIAVADDATAASWNPGGLIQLETPEVSIVGAGFYRSEDNTFSLHPEASDRENPFRFNASTSACPTSPALVPLTERATEKSLRST